MKLICAQDSDRDTFLVPCFAGFAVAIIGITLLEKSNPFLMSQWYAFLATAILLPLFIGVVSWSLKRFAPSGIVALVASLAFLGLTLYLFFLFWLKGFIKPAHAYFYALGIFSAVLPSRRTSPEASPGFSLTARLQMLAFQILGMTAVVAFLQRGDKQSQIVFALALPVVTAVLWFPQRAHSRSPQDAHRYLRLGLNAATFLLILILLVIGGLPSLDHEEAARYIGPISDVLHGKSLLYDTPSKYGYLSIWFSALLLAPFGVSFQSFHVYTYILNFLYYALFVVLFARLMKSKWAIWAVLAFLAVSLVGVSRYPYGGSEIGHEPFKLGLALLILAALVFQRRSTAFWIGNGLACTSFFFSSEACLYVCPAWLAVCLADGWIGCSEARSRLLMILRRILTFAAPLALLGTIIFLMEFRPSQGWPHFKRLFEYVTLSHSGWGMGDLLSGGLFLRFIVTVLGVSLAVHLCLRQKESPYVLVAVFLAALNFAVLTYGLVLPIQGIVVSDLLFCALLLVLIFRVLADTPPGQQAFLYRCLGAPVIVLVLSSALVAAINKWESSRYISYESRAVDFVHHVAGESPPVDRPLLVTVSEKLGVPIDRIAMYNPETDTNLLLDAGAANLLPLNPARMTTELPNWRTEYLYPALDRLEPGMLIILPQYFAGDPFDLDGWFATEIVDTVKDSVFGRFGKGMGISLLDVNLDVHRIGQRRALPLRLQGRLEEARRAVANGDLESAAPLLENLEVESPGNGYVRLNLDAVRISRGEVDAGLTSLQETVSSDSYLGTEAGFRCGEIARRLAQAGDFTTADLLYLAAEQAATTAGRQQLDWWKVCEARRRSSSEELRVYREMLLANPESAIIADSLDAECHAIDSYQGRAHVKGYTNLVTEWRNIVNAHPRARTPRHHLARALLVQGFTEEADKIHEELYGPVPRPFAVYTSDIQALISYGNLVDAVQVIEDALSKYPGQERYLGGHFSEIARLYEERKQYVAAIQMLKKANALSPHFSYHACLGNLYEAAEDPEQALNEYFDHIENNLRDGGTPAKIDAIFEKRNENSQRLERWQAFAQRHPDAPVPRLHVALAMAALGSMDEARSIYNDIADRFMEFDGSSYQQFGVLKRMLNPESPTPATR